MRIGLETLEFVRDVTDVKLTPKGYLWQKLLKRLPRKYWDRIYDFDAEDGLIDGCKFMLYLNDPYRIYGEESVPVKSITEAVQFLKEAK